MTYSYVVDIEIPETIVTKVTGESVKRAIENALKNHISTVNDIAWHVTFLREEDTV